ncbi:putative transcription factor GRAS family [Helianthus debilis subsp. tardiflorus]
MAMAVDELPEVDISDFTTTTTTTISTTNSATTPKDDHCGNWDGWSPLVDLDALLVDHEEDFGDLFESEIDEEINNVDEDQNLAWAHAMLTEPSVSALSDDSKGLRLVHLLMAAAEALDNKNHDLVQVILVRLKDLVSPNEGTNMERLGAHFTDALYNLLKLGVSEVMVVKWCNINKARTFATNPTYRQTFYLHSNSYKTCHRTRTTGQGSPTPHLRITALSRPGSGRKSIFNVQETGRRLTAFAASIGQPFTFHQCKLDTEETFKPPSVKLVRGEAIIINCMLHLPHFNHRSPTSVASFLTGSKSLNPRLVTLVEEEGQVEGGFMGRFMDMLHHYSAIYDSLEAGFPMQGRARVLVERVFLGPRIVGSVARVYREEGGSCGSWGDWLKSQPGLQPMNISFANHCQAKLLLGLFNDGYRVEEPASNKLVLGWKSRRLLSASIWGYYAHDVIA